MPLFDYKCPVCGTIARDRLILIDTAEPTCRECGYAMPKQYRMVSIASVMFKGSCWAKDNYSKNDSKSE